MDLYSLTSRRIWSLLNGFLITKSRLVRAQARKLKGRGLLFCFFLPILATLTACGVDETLLPRGFSPYQLPLVNELARSTGLGKALPLDAAFEQVVHLATPKEIQQGKVIPASYIVTFRGEAGAARRRFSAFSAEYQHHYLGLADQYLPDPRVLDINYVTTVDLQNPKDPAAVADFSPPRSLQLAWGGAAWNDTAESIGDETSLLGGDPSGVITEVTFASDAEAQAVLAEWERDGRIWFAEPNYTNELMEPPVTTAVKDAYAEAKIWWHESINLYKAFEAIAAGTTQASYSPVIAVLDSGIDIENPALANAIWTNAAPGQSGCPNDVNGCDTTKGKKGSLGSGAIHPYLTTGFNTPCREATSAEDREPGVCKHGTHVAGIIAAKLTTTGGSPIGGVCPVCRVMAIKIISADGGKGTASDAAILRGLKYLSLFKRANGNVVRVANSSFGKYTRSRAVALIVSVLRKSPNEVLLIGAAGNEDSMQRVYPAALNDAIAVSATGDNDGKATYSNFGPWVDVAAPGGDSKNGGGKMITSTVPGGQEDDQGTSMATPVVAGVAGLILAADPGRDFNALRSGIINRADPRIYKPDVNNGLNYSIYYPKISGDSVRRPLLGAGMVDAAAALGSGATTGVLSTDLTRVSAGCGVVGGRRMGEAWGLCLILSLMIMPGVPAAYRYLIRWMRGSIWRV